MTDQGCCFLRQLRCRKVGIRLRLERFGNGTSTPKCASQHHPTSVPTNEIAYTVCLLANLDSSEKGDFGPDTGYKPMCFKIDRDLPPEAV